MLLEIEKRLYQRYVLHTKKFALIREIQPRSYLASLGTLNRIHVVLMKEILVNKKLISLLHASSFPSKVEKDFVLPVCATLEKINVLLLQENRVLCRTNVFALGSSSVQKIFTGRQDYFQKQLRSYHTLTEKELELHHRLFMLSKNLPQTHRHTEKMQKSWKLVLQLQEELRKLAHALGNSELVKKHGDKALSLIHQIQKTELYEFIAQDLKYIQEKVEYVMAHPKEHKLAYFLTTVYIVAPFTFEMTGVILFFRYLGKYTVLKTRSLKKRFTRKVSKRGY